jgi:hypothetical protein
MDARGAPDRRTLARSAVRFQGGDGAAAKGIRALNEANGVPNSESEGYHETITRAYVLILAEFLRKLPGATSLEEAVRLLHESKVAERAFLLSYYERETLMAARARAQWVEPDRLPLRLP